jgi:hypothetical protein
MYSNDEKTDMILIYSECNKNASTIARLCKNFPKNSSFFTISFNQGNDVYVKIYETTQLCFMFFK